MMIASLMNCLLLPFSSFLNNYSLLNARIFCSNSNASWIFVSLFNSLNVSVTGRHRHFLLQLILLFLQATIMRRKLNFLSIRRLNHLYNASLHINFHRKTSVLCIMLKISCGGDQWSKVFLWGLQAARKIFFFKSTDLLPVGLLNRSFPYQHPQVFQHYPLILYKPAKHLNGFPHKITGIWNEWLLGIVSLCTHPKVDSNDSCQLLPKLFPSNCSF